MATGICYTWSGSTKKYEGIGADGVPDKVTVYTVGYPSTAYYPDGGEIDFSIVPYPPPPGYPGVPGFTEGTAYYITNMYLDDTGNTIYDLMSYTPPNGYVLDKNGPYTYTATASVYSYNYGIKYYDKTNIINGGTVIISREFKYKVDKQVTYIYYYVKFTLNSSRLICDCDKRANIPGTNHGNVTLGITVQLGYGKAGGRTEYFDFSWVMRDGIYTSRPCSDDLPYYLGARFTTQYRWEDIYGDGTKTYYTFDIDDSSMPHHPVN